MHTARVFLVNPAVAVRFSATRTVGRCAFYESRELRIIIFVIANITCISQYKLCFLKSYKSIDKSNDKSYISYIMIISYILYIMQILVLPLIIFCVKQEFQSILFTLLEV